MPNAPVPYTRMNLLWVFLPGHTCFHNHQPGSVFLKVLFVYFVDRPSYCSLMLIALINNQVSFIWTSLSIIWSIAIMQVWCILSQPDTGHWLCIHGTKTKLLMPLYRLLYIRRNGISMPKVGGETWWCVCRHTGIQIPTLHEIRAPDNFLKQGVADASLEAKGVFLQNAEVFSLPSFTPVRFYKLQI